MDTSYNISPGEKWHPESASRHNSLSDVLNQVGTIGPASFGSAAGFSAGGTVPCRNADDKVLKAGSYVTISFPENVSGYVFSNIYTIKAGLTDPCGVLLNDCAPGECADVQIYGLAEAEMFPAPSGVLTMPGSFVKKSLVLLNSVGHDTYRNYFKVEIEECSDMGTITKVRIFDGGNPASSICGQTDVGPVKCGSLEGAFDVGDCICLRLSVESPDGNNKIFKHTFEENSTPLLSEPVIILAEVVRLGDVRRLVQRWTGGKVNWRDRFVITTSLRGDY